MACSVKGEDRKPYVQRVVRESIKKVDGGLVSVTQDTILGPPMGLGHGALKRKGYHPEIAKRLMTEGGCRMKTLTPASFTAAALVRVRDVTALVLADLV
jgi:hypothetical protein